MSGIRRGVGAGLTGQLPANMTQVKKLHTLDLRGTAMQHEVKGGEAFLDWRLTNLNEGLGRLEPEVVFTDLSMGTTTTALCQHASLQVQASQHTACVAHLKRT